MQLLLVKLVALIIVSIGESDNKGGTQVVSWSEQIQLLAL